MRTFRGALCGISIGVLMAAPIVVSHPGDPARRTPGASAAPTVVVAVAKSSMDRTAKLVLLSPSSGHILEVVHLDRPRSLTGWVPVSVTGSPESSVVFVQLARSPNPDSPSVIASVRLSTGATSILGSGVAPAVSADGRQLAWVTDHVGGYPNTILVRSLLTGRQRSWKLAPWSESLGDYPSLRSMAWSDDERLALAVEGVQSVPSGLVLVDTKATQSGAVNGQFEVPGFGQEFVPTPRAVIRSSSRRLLSCVPLACGSSPRR